MISYSQEEKLEIFKILYPLFKNEVYNRRDQILKVATVSSGILMLMIFLGLWLKSAGIVLRPFFLPGLSGLFLFEAHVFYHLYQHKSRHEEAKKMLIRLEEQMGFFDSGVLENAKKFYPEKWKLRGLDPGFILFPVLHGGFIVLFGYLFTA